MDEREVEPAIGSWIKRRHGLDSAVRWVLWHLVLAYDPVDPFGAVGRRIHRSRLWVARRMADDGPLTLDDVSDIALACNYEISFTLEHGKVEAAAR